MNALLQQLSQGTISADDNSLYRALNRFEDVGLVASDLQPSPNGPARRYYSLTSNGRELLRRFIERNVMIFRSTEVEKKIESLRTKI
jgi:DNA-binding PadR family transcriptional regulator